MMGPTHRLIGGSSGLIASTAVGLPLPVDLGVMIVAGASSSIPDDLEKLLHLPHRRITHWPSVQVGVLGLIAVGLLYLTAPAVLVIPVVAAIAWGCVFHSIADAATVHPSGIQLLWPISRRGYHVLPRWARVWVGTKSRSEWVFVALWSAFVLSYLYARYRTYLST